MPPFFPKDTKAENWSYHCRNANSTDSKIISKFQPKKNQNQADQMTILIPLTSLRLRIVRSMSLRSGGERAWLRTAIGSPISSNFDFSTSKSRGHLCQPTVIKTLNIWDLYTKHSLLCLFRTQLNSVKGHHRNI